MLFKCNKNIDVKFRVSLVEHDYSNLLLVLEKIYTMMRDTLNFGDINKLNIVFNDFSYPMSLNEANLIILVSPESQFNRAAYQFSHELCHFVILGKVNNSLLWFEEAICELSSYYFLTQLSFVWKSNKIPIKITNSINVVSLKDSKGKPYPPLFKSYVENDAKKEKYIQLKGLLSNPKIKDFENDPVQREYNAYLSNKMLPIFTKYPKTWHAIPCWGLVKSNNLKDALYEWYELSPMKSKVGIKKILNLFGI